MNQLNCVCAHLSPPHTLLLFVSAHVHLIPLFQSHLESQILIWSDWWHPLRAFPSIRIISTDQENGSLTESVVNDTRVERT